MLPILKARDLFGDSCIAGRGVMRQRRCEGRCPHHLLHSSGERREAGIHGADAVLQRFYCHVLPLQRLVQFCHHAFQTIMQNSSIKRRVGLLLVAACSCFTCWARWEIRLNLALELL